MKLMRIALVSPYSWSYPGGVTRHIEALAEQLGAQGHEVRVLAPYDPPDGLSAVLHRGARPQPRDTPDYLISLGRTIGIPANGAVSNVSFTPYGLATMRRELRTGGYDVVHVHEPIAPIPSWDASLSTRGVPLVSTHHTFSAPRLPNALATIAGARRVMNRYHVKIAVSEAAAWTNRRYFGGRYRIIPNGVDIPADRPAKTRADHLRIVFVGQAVERKGLPILLRAFEALREHVPATLTVVGADHEALEPMLLDPSGVTALGKVDDEAKLAALSEADVLCAPSLGGESFGMVLTEAFAAGTPVIASDIAGYRDVVRDGVDGILVPRGDARALAESLRELWLVPARRVELGRAAAAHAERYAWPHVAEEVVGAYEDAIAVGEPEGVVARVAVRHGVKPADLEPAVRARRLPSLDPAPPGSARRGAIAFARRAAVLAGGAAGLGLAYFALQRIGINKVVSSLINATPSWVFAGLALMCLAMALRAVAWQAILKAALPGTRVRLVDAMQGTFIGVLMSATLPARLGEPSRALIVARRTGRPRDNLPVVLGTVISQTLLNLVALGVLGAIMFSSVSVFSGHQTALLFAAIGPVVLLLVVLVMPTLLARGNSTQSRRVRVLLARVRNAMAQVRSGLAVFRSPRLGLIATLFQLAAWAVQCFACYVLLAAFGLDEQVGFAAAAAVLFAVNVTAVLPATPSNLGVFQAATVAVLHGAYHASSADALGYGIVLQVVEIATAVFMGMPALVKEGLSWRDVRLRAMHAGPITLPPLPGGSRAKKPGDAAEAAD
jgi:phosphatidylinositol alpha-mannosyltransferase